MSEKAELLTGDIRRTFLKYLIPSVGGMLGVSLYVLGDTMIVGRGLGSQGLAALNISIPLINVLNGLGLLFGIGGATLLSISRGQNREDKVNEIFTCSIIMSLLLGLIVTLFRIFYIDEICYFLGASEDTFQMARDYLGVLLSFSIPFILNSTMTVFVRNDGAPNLAMWGMLTGSVINVILDYIFIFKFKWGMRGGAIATVISPIIGLIILSVHFLRKNNHIKLIIPRLNLNTINRILSNGSASFIVELSGGVVIFVFNKVILDITGDIGVSAYSIIANLSLICTAIFIGVGQAIQPIVSLNYGANKMDRVYMSVKLALYVAFGLGIIFYLIGIFFPGFLVSIFSKDNEELMLATVRGIRIYFLSFILMGVNIVITTYIQSMEHSKISTGISLMRGLILIIIFLMILPRIFGLDGVWLTLPVVEFVTALVSFITFKQYRNAILSCFKIYFYN